MDKNNNPYFSIFLLICCLIIQSNALAINPCPDTYRNELDMCISLIPHCPNNFILNGEYCEMISTECTHSSCTGGCANGRCITGGCTGGICSAGFTGGSCTGGSCTGGCTGGFCPGGCTGGSCTGGCTGGSCTGGCTGGSCSGGCTGNNCGSCGGGVVCNSSTTRIKAIHHSFKLNQTVAFPPVFPTTVRPIGRPPQHPIYPDFTEVYKPSPPIPQSPPSSVQPSSISNVIEITNIIHNNNTINNPTNINSTNINNVYVYGSNSTGALSRDTSHNKTVVIDTDRETRESCCTVVSPRQCRNENNRWVCFHRKYKRCGMFCTNPKVFIRPVRPIHVPPVVVMPPRPRYIQPQIFTQHRQNCHGYNCPQINCSGCGYRGRSSYCSPECYSYDCQGDDCGYVDQKSFCGTYGGYGCSEEDGCYASDGCSDISQI